MFICWRLICGKFFIFVSVSPGLFLARSKQYIKCSTNKINRSVYVENHSPFFGTLMRKKYRVKIGRKKQARKQVNKKRRKKERKKEKMKKESNKQARENKRGGNDTSCSLTWCWTINPVSVGLIIPDMVPAVLVTPNRTLAKAGAMSRWLIRKPDSAKPFRPIPNVIIIMAVV